MLAGGNKRRHVQVIQRNDNRQARPRVPPLLRKGKKKKKLGQKQAFAGRIMQSKSPWKAESKSSWGSPKFGRTKGGDEV